MTPVKVEAHCDECDIQLHATGQITLSRPPTYIHVCYKCGKHYYLDQTYPKIEYVLFRHGFAVHRETGQIMDSNDLRIHLGIEKS